MARFSGLRRFFRLDRAADVEGSVNDELAFHFENRVRELMQQGLSAREARQEAERRFGDVERTRARLAEIDRDARRSEWWSGFFQDLRYALRGLRLKPGFTLGVVLTLGLGIGANATMFGIVDRLLFQPPPGFVHPDQVHHVYFVRTSSSDNTEFPGSNIGYKRYLDMVELSRGLSDFSITFEPSFAVGTGEDAREERFQGVSGTFWRLAGVQPEAGRFFGPAEDSLPEAARVVVLDHTYWLLHYGGRASAIGETMKIGRHDYTIIGVAPKGFRGLAQRATAGFLPALAAIQEDGNDPNTYSWSWPEMIVRRAPGTSVEAATTSLSNAYQVSYARQAAEQPQLRPIALAKPHVVLGSIISERGPRPSNEAKVALWLIGVSAIVLIIACANVGNLLLARAFGRRREIAVRLALGISRRRLLAQLLTESLLLALLGGAAGLLIAQWGGGILRRQLLPDVAWLSTLADARVLVFSLGAAVFAGVLAGLAPALHAAGGDVAASLKAGVREGTYHRSRLRTTLLVVQGALSVVLLVGAALFVRSFQQVRALRLGFDTDQLLFVDPQSRGVRLDSAARIALRERMVEAAQSVPGVERAARALTVPFRSTWDYNIVVPGLDTAFLNRFSFTIQAGTPAYFATMGTRLLAGRGITDADRDGSPPVMVASASMAKTLWPGQDPIGKCVKIAADTVPCTTVVGVAEDVKHSDFHESEDPGLNYYLPASQFAPAQGGVMVRTSGPADQLSEAVRRAVQRVMPGTSYVTVTAMSELLGGARRQWQLGATMFSIFGILAVLVAAVGLYSVVAYGVAQRSHELGVRVALGAQAPDVVRLVLGEALRVALVAAAIGTAAAAFAAKWIAPLLFDTSPRDPVILASVACGLLAIAAIASLGPALRAARVDPNVALRAD